MFQGRHHSEELHVLHCLDGQRPLQMVLQQFLGNLDDADAGSNRLAREMGTIDGVVGLQADVIDNSALPALLALDGV